MTTLLASRRRPTRIAGLGSARPDSRIDAAELVAPFGKSAEWLHQRTGIKALRRLAAGESLTELATRAARAALADSGSDHVDAVLVATCSSDARLTDRFADRLAAELAPRAIAFDVNAVCAGFCYALGTASSLVETGSAERVLVVGAERMSGLIDPDDLGTSILFGDGAGAAVVTVADGDEPGIGAPAWSSDGSAVELLHVPAGESALRMAGRAVFRWAVDEVPKVAAEAITKAGLRPDDIEVFVPHQANLRIVEAVARKIGLHNAVVADDIVESGNTSAASVPLALDRLRAASPHLRGRLALLVGFGAGLTIAAQVVRLP